MLPLYMRLTRGVLNPLRSISSSSESLKSSKINTKKVLMELRKKTGYPLINCRQALQATNYDIDQAEIQLTEIAKQKGWDKLQDKSRAVLEGLVSIVTNKSSVALIEVNCETDFVAKTEPFQNIVKDAAQATLANFCPQPGSKASLPVETLLKMSYPGKKAETFEDAIALAIGKLKEAVRIRRGIVVTPSSSSHIGTYIHPSMLSAQSRPRSSVGTYAAAVIFSVNQTGDEPPPSANAIKSRGRELAQHVVGMNPLSVGTPPETVYVEVDDDDQFQLEQATDSSTGGETPPSRDGSGKQHVATLPPDDGSSELLKQAFLLDSSVSVAEWLQLHQLQVEDFVRYRVGEELPAAGDADTSEC